MSPSEVVNKGQNQSIEEQKGSINDNESTKPDTQTKINEFRNSLLPDIDNISELDETDSAALEEIRATLEKYGKLERFGVCLLHTHFAVSEDEVLVETCDPENRELLTRTVAKENQLAQNIVETMWRFDDPKLGRTCFRTCSANGPNGTHKNKHVQGA